jgi:type I restriction enzyme S subunit
MPIPPVDEQEQVVGEVERRLSIIEELDTVVLANQRRAESFRSSLLQRAFEGKLLASVSDKSPSLLLLDAEFSHEGA